MDYPILYQRKAVGTAQAERRGLYWHISCLCCLPSRELHRIRMDSATKSVDLGICVPMEGQFGLRKTVTLRQAGEGDFTFILTGNREEPPKEEHAVALKEGEPVACLSRLEDAHLEIREDQPCLVFTDRSPVPQDSDPTPEPGNISEQP